MELASELVSELVEFEKKQQVVSRGQKAVTTKSHETRSVFVRVDSWLLRFSLKVSFASRCLRTTKLHEKRLLFVRAASWFFPHFRRVFCSSRFCSSANFFWSRSIQPSKSAAAFSNSSLFSRPRRSASKNARVRTLYASFS
jgi:hypothetical protein